MAITIRKAGSAPASPSSKTSEDMPPSTGEKRTRGVHFNEVGASGLRHVGGFIREEMLRDLQGPNGIKVLREMGDNDPVIGGFTFAVEQAIRQVDWKVIVANDSDEARKYANFVDSCRLDMQQTWGDVLTEAMSFLQFGWSMLEVTYKIRRGYQKDPALTSRYEDGLVGWKAMELRSQESMRRWVYDDTNKDKLVAMQQFTIEKGTVDIPISRCVHFRTKSYKNNPEGRSIYRNAYRPWFFKKRIEEIEGIGLERDMAGLPVLVAAEGLDLWNENDPQAVATRKAAEEIVRNIRVDEQMGVLLPFGWELSLLATGGKRAINTVDIVNRYDQRIAMTVLADFILLGTQNRLGSFALAKSKTSMFAMSLVGYLNVLRDTFNTQELPRLWRLNGFPPEMMPRLDYTPVDTPSLKDLASYLSALSGCMIDFSVPELQRYLLQLAGVPGDITDLAGRGGTGDMQDNRFGTDVEPEEDDDESGDTSNTAGGGRAFVPGSTTGNAPGPNRPPANQAGGRRLGSPTGRAPQPANRPKPRIPVRRGAAA